LVGISRDLVILAMLGIVLSRDLVILAVIHSYRSDIFGSSVYT